MRNKLGWHQVVLIGAMSAIALWRFLTGQWTISLYPLWWALGMILGFLSVFGDKLVYLAINDMKALMDWKIKESLQFLLLEKEGPREHLVMRSALFVGAWIILAFFSLVEVANPIARGLVAGIGVHLIFDLGWDYLDKDKGIEGWFWQIKRTLQKDEIRWFWWGSLVLSLVAISML